MKLSSLSIFVFGLLIAITTQAEDLCQKSEIGKQIDLNILGSNGQKNSKSFVIAACKNNFYTANEAANGPNRLKFKASASDSKLVEFSDAHSDSEFKSVAIANWDVKKSELNFDRTVSNETCPPNQHPDPSMGGMCMPNECPPNQVWDPNMGMCMPGQADHSLTTMFHYNQFMVYTTEQGPRGRDAFSGPNMWMLMVNKKTSDANEVGLSWMGTIDKWTVPTSGTPELLQTGETNKSGVPYVDAQHPHSSPIMGLTFYDILSLGQNGQHKLTFFFAPRGEATAGPTAFMHRASAQGNSDAPLAHHLQDVFHITSTVVGAKLQIGEKTTIEASTFSGHEPSPSEVNLDMHNPDSYGVRVNQILNSHFTVGASAAKVSALDRGIGPQPLQHEMAYSSWLTTSHMIRSGQLDTSTIWGQIRNREEAMTLNSYLEEFVYQLGKNNFFGRVEVLQRTPQQLEIQLTDGSTGARWVKALTLGYERKIIERKEMNVYFGAAETQDYLPVEFKDSYGGNPLTSKVFFRVTWRKSP